MLFLSSGLRPDTGFRSGLWEAESYMKGGYSREFLRLNIRGGVVKKARLAKGKG